MTTRLSVLGCVGLCWVGFANSTQVCGLVWRGFEGAVWGVLGSRARARDVRGFNQQLKGGFFSLCEAGKTQHTQHTQHKKIKGFVFISFLVCWVCVGLVVFVLGRALEALA